MDHQFQVGVWDEARGLYFRVYTIVGDSVSTEWTFLHQSHCCRSIMAPSEGKYLHCGTRKEPTELPSHLATVCTFTDLKDGAWEQDVLQAIRQRSKLSISVLEAELATHEVEGFFLEVMALLQAHHAI